MRIGVAATAPLGADVLERLAATHEVAFLLTRPDAPRGRGRKVAAPPAKEAAEQLGIPVHQPAKPELPEEYKSWLLSRTVSARVTSVGPSRLRDGKADIRFRITDIALDVGKADGVYPGMEFYLLDDSSTSAKVTRVEDRQSTAEIVEVLSEGSEGRTPKAGVSVSSKPPWR